MKFNDRANNAINTAAASAMQLSPKQIKLVYEPTAAAVAAHSDDDSNATRLLIYDFGGGTFDVSLMQRDKGLLERLRGKKRSPKEILQRHRRQTTYEPPPVESSFVLDIKDANDMKAYLSRLKNQTAFEEFLSRSPLQWLRTRLDRVNKIIAVLDS